MNKDIEHRTDDKDRQESSRRRLLKALTLSGGAVTVSKLPGAWSKPVVDSVVLPAHAQTTAPADEPTLTRVIGGGGGSSSVVSTDGEFRSLLGNFVPEAHAGAISFNGCTQFSFDRIGNKAENVRIVILAPRCGTPPKGPTYPSFQNKKMVNKGGGMWEYTSSNNDAEGRTYRVELHITDPKAAVGEKFGTCVITRVNSSSGEREYAQIDCIRGAQCFADEPECEPEPD